ncbi:MAG: prenyltransferase [Gemmatimonadetes bacterium]|nr:prenyltransferase [Gemmatimonadota bacterium]
MPETTRSFGAGFWRLADPKISLASFASLFLGAAAAAAGGPLHWGWLAVTVAGIFALEVAKNASGEVFDYDSGTDLAIRPEDRSPFSGGKRVLVDGLLSRGETWAIAVAGYALSVAAGLGIVAFREPRVLWIGLAGVACAYFYHAPPLRLAYRGLGELAVALCYGPLIAAGAYLVQRGELPVGIMVLGIPLGLLIGAFLIINEFPDYLADRGSGKRTLVVRLGRVGGSRLFALVVGSALLWTLLLPIGGMPLPLLLGLLAAAPAVAAVRTLLRSPEVTAAIVPAQGQALLAFLLYAVGAGIGLLLGA